MLRLFTLFRHPCANENFPESSEQVYQKAEVTFHTPTFSRNIARYDENKLRGCSIRNADKRLDDDSLGCTLELFALPSCPQTHRSLSNSIFQQ
jgi:hypothetical protein